MLPFASNSCMLDRFKTGVRPAIQGTWLSGNRLRDHSHFSFMHREALRGGLGLVWRPR